LRITPRARICARFQHPGAMHPARSAAPSTLSQQVAKQLMVTYGIQAARMVQGLVAWLGGYMGEFFVHELARASRGSSVHG
jgi:hypothetical protein